MTSNQHNVTVFRKAINWIKERYQLVSDLDVLLVFILFAVTGSSAVKLARPLLAVFGVTSQTSNWIFIPVRIFAVFIAYQFLFVAYGFVIGLIRKPVWNFAWGFEKKMLSRFGIKFQ